MARDEAKLRRYIDRFAKTRIVVVGDVMLDRYIWGTVDRISPEAPVPVVHVDSESMSPGGAANVFANIVSLGGKADLCGVIGKDEAGQMLLDHLGLQKSNGGIVVEPERPTTRKTRILAHSQQVVRYDVEQRTDVSRHTTRRILDHIKLKLSDMTCLVVSDYSKGVVTPSLMAELHRLCSPRNIPIVVDPKVEHFPYYAGVTVMTPNHLEAQKGAGLHHVTGHGIAEAGHWLREKLGCQAVLVTRGEQGMTLCEAPGTSWHIPTMAREVFDVTGAGDTVVSTLALALGAGATLREAAYLANHAAGVVVGMVGTATVTAAQLKKALKHAGS